MRRLLCRVLGHCWGERQWMLWLHTPAALRECRRCHRYMLTEAEVQ